MNDNLSAFTRFSIQMLLIILGYAAASLASGFYVNGLLIFAPGEGTDASRNITDYLTFALFISTLIAFYAAPWAFFVIAWGEFKAWRMWWYYAVAGAFIGSFLGWMFLPRPWAPFAGLAFGPVSGAIFWSIAGRKSGAHNAVGILVITLSALGVLIMAAGYGPMLSRLR